MVKIALYIIYASIITVSVNCACPPELINLSRAKQAVIQYHESGEYDADVQGTVKTIPLDEIIRKYK